MNRRHDRDAAGRRLEETRRPALRPKTDPPRGLLQLAPNPETRILHRRFEAADDLAPWVEHYWTVAWNFAGLPAHPVASLPHPSVHMVFEADGRGGVAGPARARFTRLLEGRSDVFAVKFVPGGFRAFATGPVSRLADTERASAPAPCNACSPSTSASAPSG